MGLSACTTFEFIPPNSDAGRQCVATCETALKTCEAGAKQAAATKEAACESRESNVLALCLALASDKPAKEKCTKARKTCFAVPESYRCAVDHRNCFRNCGGKVIEVK